MSGQHPYESRKEVCSKIKAVECTTTKSGSTVTSKNGTKTEKQS